MTCEADYLPFYPFLRWIHHRNPDRATYALILLTPRLHVFFILCRHTFPRPTLLGMRK